jgi:hypothetical protein
MDSSDSNGNSDRTSPATRSWTVWLILAATMTIVVLCAAIIWYRFLITPETNCTIVVAGDKLLDGDIVEVTPTVAAEPALSHLTVTLEEQNQYSARFFLSSGTYQVKILRPDGSTVADLTDFVPPGRTWRYDAAQAQHPSTTQPALMR